MSVIFPKVLFLTTLSVTGAGIYYSHWKQEDDRQQLRQGIVKDLQRQQMKKTENIFRLQQQIDLTRQYKEVERKEKEAAARLKQLEQEQ